MDGVVPAVRRADRPRRSHVVRPGSQRVVRSLAVGRADRVDRRQVDHVEAHRGHRGEPRGCGPEGAGPQHAVGVGRRALGAGEELVPAAEQRAFAVDPKRQPVARADEVAKWLRGQGGDHRRVVRRGEAGGDRSRRVPQGGGGVHQSAAPCGRTGRTGCALEHPGAFLQHQLDVDTGVDLDGGVVVPGRHRVAPRLDREGPASLAGRRDLGRPAVGARGTRRHRGERTLATLGVAQHDVRVDHVVALAEHRRRHREGFADDGFGRPATAVHGGLHVEDGDATDHRGRTYPGTRVLHTPRGCRSVRRAPGVPGARAALSSRR